MEIRKYRCNHCDIEHVEKTYENKSEAMADIFVENSFKNIWENFKEKHKEMPMEDFCKEFAFEYIYHFHRNLKRIKFDKYVIKPTNNSKDNVQDPNKEEDTLVEIK